MPEVRGNRLAITAWSRHFAPVLRSVDLVGHARHAPLDDAPRSKPRSSRVTSFRLSRTRTIDPRGPLAFAARLYRANLVGHRAARAIRRRDGDRAEVSNGGNVRSLDLGVLVSTMPPCPATSLRAWPVSITSVMTRYLMAPRSPWVAPPVARIPGNGIVPQLPVGLAISPVAYAASTARATR
jgi:hypothetical protein